LITLNQDKGGAVTVKTVKKPESLLEKIVRLQKYILKIQNNYPAALKEVLQKELNFSGDLILSGMSIATMEMIVKRVKEKIPESQII